MKSPRWLASCAFAVSLVPSFALADEPPSLAQWTKTRVTDGILVPLVQNESVAFSRARPVARERRVRVLQAAAANDKSGNPFVSFAIDVRFGHGAWQTNDIVGCAYVRTGELFVKRGDGYRPAAYLLGKNVDPVPGVCEAVPAASKNS